MTDPLEHLDFEPDPETEVYLTNEAMCRMQVEAALCEGAICLDGETDEEHVMKHLVDHHLMPVVRDWVEMALKAGHAAGVAGEPIEWGADD